jgi:hypothetical protein
MAHIWRETRLQRVANGQTISSWQIVPLSEGAMALGSALLLRCRDATGEVWLIMDAAPPRVRLNGSTLTTGIHVLQDRDEILVPGSGRMFFSNEVLAHVEPFPGGSRPAACPRCKEGITAAQLAVRCPQCQLWYHQKEDRLCWTYADTCALCPQPTALDAGFRWTPEAV